MGGQFAVGVTLVAEVVPQRARPYALGMVQAFSTVGNMLAAATGIFLGQIQQSGTIAARVEVRISRPRTSGAIGVDSVQETQGARSVAESALREEEHGVAAGIVLQSPVEAQFNHRNAAGFFRSGGALGYRFL